MINRNDIQTTRPHALQYKVGMRVRVLTAPKRVFAGHVAVVRGYTRSGKFYALEFVDHPWQVANPPARWFFRPHEIEAVGAEC